MGRSETSGHGCMRHHRLQPAPSITCARNGPNLQRVFWEPAQKNLWRQLEVRLSQPHEPAGIAQPGVTACSRGSGLDSAGGEELLPLTHAAPAALLFPAATPGLRKPMVNQSPGPSAPHFSALDPALIFLPSSTFQPGAEPALPQPL